MENKKNQPNLSALPRSKLWVELELGTEMMLVPGGTVIRSSSEVSESQVFIPGKHKEFVQWAEEILSTKE